MQHNGLVCDAYDSAPARILGQKSAGLWGRALSAWSYKNEGTMCHIWYAKYHDMLKI